MIQIEHEKAEKAVDIVIEAMEEMKEIQGKNALAWEVKIECARAIAALAATIETRPRFVFGDIGGEKEK